MKLKTKVNRFVWNIIMKTFPKKELYKMHYYKNHKERLNLNNPKCFNEKLYWLLRYNELYNSDLIKEIYDKNRVRKYVKAKGLEDILIPQIDVFYDVEVDINSLPNEFILKFSQGSHNTIICKDKDKLDLLSCKEKFDNWFKAWERDKNNRFDGFYYSENPSIVCEELLHTADGKIPDDIKIFCSNGRVLFLYVDIDSIDENDKKKQVFQRHCYDEKWNCLPIMFCQPRADGVKLEKPKNFDKMINIAKKLSEDFVFVRVDLYNIDGDIKFGELTPMPGMAAKIKPEGFDKWLGMQIKLPNVKIFDI